MPNTAMTYTASKLRLPKSIKKDCDTMIQHIEELCREYQKTKELPMEECLSVKPKTDPTITHPSTSTPRLPQNDDENTNRMEIDPVPSSQNNDTSSTSHKIDRQSVASNNPPSETANNYQNSQPSATNQTNEQTSRRHSARLANVINPESSPNEPPPPFHTTQSNS
ncbi:hypothetical protein VP01_10792g1 [Puccinia sorghi]|uniref:Uncharacterized protein n=1 Tax=Puccinia sorghi TaxID=27349 RepID=A0A0L6VTF6_9BASI|nr:hypothetical protein VP01_10792g1 [Puccinia sorghi]